MKKSIKKNFVTAILFGILTSIAQMISDGITFSSPSVWSEFIRHFLILSITYLIVGALFDYFFGNEKK